MRLAAHAEGIVAADIERVAIDRRVAEGEAMALDRLAGDFVQADAFDRGRRAGEIGVDQRPERPTASKICAPQ